MASSKSSSITKAQKPSLCHLCEDSLNIQWKCVDCNLLMCSKCKTKVHSKFKAADDHDVISLKEVSAGPGQQKKPNFQNITCKTHKDQKVCLFCHNCEEIVCHICVTGGHRKHDFEDLRKVYEDRVCKLEYLYEEMKANMQFVADEENKINRKSEKQDGLNDTMKQDILRQKEALIRTVESEAENRLQILKHSNIQHHGYVSSVKAEYAGFKKEIQSKMSTVEATLHENCIETIIHADKNLIPSLTNKKTPSNGDKPNNFEFYPGKIDQESVSQMFGLLQQTNEGPELKIGTVASYKTKFEIVTNLYSCSNGTMFVCDEQTAQCMISMQFQDPKIKALKETKNIQVFGITEIEGNEFVVSFIDKTELKRIRPNGKFETFLDLSPLLPRALHLTRSGKLLVSVREQGDTFPLKNTSERKLMVMTTDGKLIHEYYLDNQKKMLFSLLYRVTTAPNSDIFAIDRVSYDSDGRVVALGYPNKIVWRYEGNDSINAKIPFRPNGIVVTENCNIVVTDLDTSILHILSISGSLKYSFDVGKIDIEYPFSLASDTRGFLWIGCTQKTGTRLHIINIPGI